MADTDTAPETTQGKTFSQEDVDRIVKDRLARQAGQVESAKSKAVAEFLGARGIDPDTFDDFVAERSKTEDKAVSTERELKKLQRLHAEAEQKRAEAETRFSNRVASEALFKGAVGIGANERQADVIKQLLFGKVEVVGEDVQVKGGGKLEDLIAGTVKENPFLIAASAARAQATLRPGYKPDESHRTLTKEDRRALFSRLTE